MASVKVSADSLEQQKKEYEKAVKNLDQAIEQIKKVNASLGKDAMLDGVREALTKLSASLETRSGVLLLMTKALEQSCTKYTAAQKKAVTKSSQFRAHNRDFYGNPVVVTAAAGAGAAAGVSAGAAAMSQSSETVYTQRGSDQVISQVSEHARNVAASKVPAAEGSNMESKAVSVGGAGHDGAQGKIDSEAVDGGFLDEKIAGAAAAGAAIGGMAGGMAGVLAGKQFQKEERNADRSSKQEKKTPGEKKQSTKEAKQEPSTDIEAQLEAARERLRRFDEMEMEEKR